MLARTQFRLACLILATAALLLGQGLDTKASKDDWEEINFEFNSSVLSDGYPSLLRLAELLQKNPDFKVTLEGNTDSVGSVPYNDKLSRARAEMVQRFLVKYGARGTQISMVPRGKSAPKVPNTTKEGRFMNRRVVMVVRDGKGNVISDGGVGDAIKAMQAQPAVAAKEPGCCSDILKRLDKLDEILAALQGLKAENDRLKKDQADMQESLANLRKQVEGLPRPPERAEVQQIVETAAEKAIDAAKPSRFSLLGVNIGPTLSDSLFSGYGKGNITITAKGRYFAPFGKSQTTAVQAEGEYMYYRDRQEGQFDLGLVQRLNKFQLGLFNSVKHVHLSDLGGGTLAQGSVTGDYLFSRGRIGFFGTKGYLDNRVIARTPLGNSFNVWTEHYLKIVDQIGASTSVGVWNDAYIDANIGALFRRGGENRPGGMARLVQPITERLAFTVEAGLNETMLGGHNTGRLVFGLQFGNWLRPKQYAEVKHAVPTEVPRLRYELLTRTVRTGNAPPTADAGPDLAGVAAGTITLDGSGSFDVDGDAITHQWTQVSGPGVTLSATNAPKVTFTAAEGASYTFRLTVRDSQGAQATDAVTITTAATPRLRVLRYVADPATLTSGQSTTLSWQLENAESAEISGIGPVNATSGSVTVAPTATTTYTLTARGKGSQSTSEAVVVNVTTPQAAVLFFQVSPAVIQNGETASLSWQTQNAQSVEISGIGAVSLNGTAAVAPTQTTTYTLTARGKGGQTTTAQATITVTSAPAPNAPLIIAFTSRPLEIAVGESTELFWDVKGATEVTISSIGQVNQIRGVRSVNPVVTTTYTLTAKNGTATSTATHTVAVLPPVKITSFTVNKTSVAYGEQITFTWTTENARSVRLGGLPVTVSGSYTLTANPGVYEYVLTAEGNRTTDRKTITVTAQ